MSADEEKVEFLGYGVYKGDEVPTADVFPLLARMKKPNPKIELDSGVVVWGFQCWWAPEDEIREFLDGGNVVEVKLGDPA